MCKVIKIFACILVFSLVISVCSACSGSLNGTYVLADNENIWINVKKLYFQGSRVTVTDRSFPVTCQYEIKDGKIIMNGTAMVFGTEVSVDYEFAFEKLDNSIYLDGVEYIKEK